MLFVNWIALSMTESKCDGWQFFSEFLNLKTSKTCSGPTYTESASDV